MKTRQIVSALTLTIGTDMTHDPLCYANTDCEANENYLCDQIAIVRKEERQAAVQRLEAKAYLTADFLTLKGVTLLRITDVIDAIKGDKK